MYKWTDDANRELENYLEQVALLATDRGDDPQEIVEGLRDHVTQEAETNGETLITAERVRAILAQLGSAEEVVGVEAGESNRSNDQSEPVVMTQVTSELESQRPEKCDRKGRFWSFVAKIFVVFAICDAFAAIFIAAGIMGNELFAGLISSGFGNNLMPTAWHFWGLLLVPIAIIYNLCTLWRRSCTSDKDGKSSASQVNRPWRIRLGLILNGYVLIVSIYYMLAFVPMLPIAIIGVIFILGLLPLSPYFTFFVGLLQIVPLVRRAREVRVTGHWAWLGVLVGFTIYGGWIIHHYACENAIRLAISTNSIERKEGIRKIKALHGENKILMGCYRAYPTPFMTMGRPVRVTMMGRSNRFASPAEFQTLYYRMTGLDYRSTLRSEVTNMRNQIRRPWDDWEMEWATDSEIGGSVVGTRVEGLSLNSSTIDAVVAGDREQNNAGPCVAYVQWVFEFKNNSTRQREARCQIQMPPGSVGSRLTLWIDGVEQEAAFGKRSAVKKAYKEVAVQQRRDPALLTTDGPGQLLLQCFPIEPNSKMKVKVGMSVPLVVREMKVKGLQKPKTQAILRLPYLADRNFTIAKDFNHDVWAEGVVPMRSPLLETEQPKESLFAIRGKVTESDLQEGTKAIIKLDAPELAKTLYTAELHGFAGSDMLVANRPFETTERTSTRTVAIVVDTSRNAQSVRYINWKAFFKTAPKGIDFSLFVGANSKENLSADQAGKVMRELFTKATFDAADEQTGNLEKAWDDCAKAKHGLVLWVHGLMPYELSSCSGLIQRMTRRPGHFSGANPRIASVQIVPGPNLIEQSLNSVTGMFRVPVLGSAKETLNDLAKNLDRPGLVASRLEFNFYTPTLEEENVEKTEVETESTDSTTEEKIAARQKSSDQMVRIALGQKVYRECQKKLKLSEQVALSEEAAKLRLITPLTGAVVLERKEQYAKHGLDPTANTEATADIPEPETWVLLIAIFITFALMIWRRRQCRERIPSPCQ